MLDYDMEFDQQVVKKVAFFILSKLIFDSCS
jgi:hypothetical protein